MPFLNLLNYALILVALLLAVPVVTFTVECLAALLPQRSNVNTLTGDRPKTAILIPAHNEAEQIGLVVQKARKQLKPEELLVVIADNCQDNTAVIAKDAGATVIERVDKVEKGKGYALDRGLRYLEDINPPEVVVFLDADCLMSEGAIANIASLAYQTQRPVQAQYLMEQPDNPSLKDRVSAFALKVKNRVRFLGLNRLNAHSLLTGSGMAFPWSAIQKASLVGAINADDMKLTVDLALEDSIPTYCESALVMGRLMKDQDAQSQRTRWEHGHLQMISREVPKLIKGFVKQPRLDYLLLALDISIPPLSLLVMLWFAATAISVLSAVLLGISWLSTIVLGTSGLLLFVAVISVWSKFGTEELPFKDLVAIPFYIVSKIPIYIKFIVNPEKGWFSTERDL